MLKLNDQEIKFVKETKFTPTVFQCDEYYRTPFKNASEASEVALRDYGVDLAAFLKKNLDQNDTDSISLEYVATYLFYTFFSEEELLNIFSEDALKWLQDYRYYLGFRKWDADDVAQGVEEAVEIYRGEREFYITEDNQVWNRELTIEE